MDRGSSRVTLGQTLGLDRFKNARITQTVALIFVGLVLCLVVGVGISWAFARGGRDFAVFYEAWRLVLLGQGAQIYHQSPDRFLYSPGFAWLFSPLAYLSLPVALGVWCGLKVIALVFLVKKLSEPWIGRGHLFGWLGSCIGILLVSKPLLIDFEYGQVNLLILTLTVWALSNRSELDSPAWLDVTRWTAFSFVAFAKIFPLPILLVPCLVTLGISKKKVRFERLGILFGFCLTFGPPILDQGASGLYLLLQNWAQAVLQKGLPLESHNQSFTALLFHYLSGVPTAVRSEGPAPVLLGGNWLIPEQISLLSSFWSATTLGLAVGWLLTGGWREPARWIAVAIGFLIIPSHLIWKTYFVLSAPLAVFLVQSQLRDRRVLDGFLLLVFFIGMNFSGFDFMGHALAASLEAASLFLILHLVILIRVVARR